MKNILYILTFIGTLFLGACDNEEFFELVNPVESPWQSLSDFDKAPIGAYYGLTGNGGFRTIFAAGRVAGETYADGVQLAPQEGGFQRDADTEDIYNRVTGTQVTLFDNAIFRSGYFAVGFANGALDFIEQNNGNPYPTEGRPDEVRRIEGELRFVRAYAYYWLARIYLPPYPNDEKRIPFRTNQAQTFEEAKFSELASANDIYGLIVEDLQRAKEILPTKYDPDRHPPAYADGRANKFAAAALLAKVYFQMGMQAEAEAELNYVIDQNGGEYDLSEDPIEAFNKTGVTRGKEVIWYYALWAGDGLGGTSNWKHPGRLEWYNGSNRFASGPQANNGRFIHASDAFLEQAGWQDSNGDATPEAMNDKRYTQLFLRLTPSSSTDTLAENTFPEPNPTFTTTRDYVWGHKYYRAGDRLTNLPILRLADMYLMRAIIRAQNGNAAGARADLNMVRNRAGIGDFTGSDAELEQAIHTERFKEMAFEGDRLYYLQALRLDIPAGDRGGNAVPWDSPFYSEVPDFEKEINEAYLGTN